MAQSIDIKSTDQAILKLRIFCSKPWYRPSEYEGNRYFYMQVSEFPADLVITVYNFSAISHSV